MKVGHFSFLKLLLNSGATDFVLETAVVFVLETAVVLYTSCCAMAKGHHLNTSIVLAAVHGLLGLPGQCARSSLQSLPPSPPPPPPVPVPNKHPCFCDVKQRVYRYGGTVNMFHCLCQQEAELNSTTAAPRKDRAAIPIFYA